MPFAIEATSASSAGVRITGARVVQLIASNARDALPHLVRLLADPVAEVRFAALDAFSECANDARPYAERIAVLVAHGDSEEERQHAAEALANIEA